MEFIYLTLFPDLIKPYWEDSLLNKAFHKGFLSFQILDIRDYALDKHRTCDDTPYGGGPGMVLKPEPIFRAAEKALDTNFPKKNLAQWVETTKTAIVLLSARGRPFSQKKAYSLSHLKRILFICGRYEGIDERVAQFLATDKISLGPYVFMGGEAGSILITESVARLCSGVLGSPESLEEESHSFSGGSYLEYPQYTKPANFRGLKVPDILLSGHHQKIKKWRDQQRKIYSF